MRSHLRFTSRQHALIIRHAPQVDSMLLELSSRASSEAAAKAAKAAKELLKAAELNVQRERLAAGEPLAAVTG